MRIVKMNKKSKNYLPVNVGISYELNAHIDEAFPFISPVMEYKWIPGWTCEIIHFPNGKMEKGCVFKEFTSAPILSDSIAQKTT